MPAKGLKWPSNRLLPQFAAPAAVIDCVDLSDAERDEIDLCASLEGILNRTQPRLIAVSDSDGEGKFTWINVHDLDYKPIDLYDAVLKYKSAVSGLVVTDRELRDTLNLATTIAGLKDELICDAPLLKKLTNAPFNFRIVDDLRGRFADKAAVYGFLYTNYWPRCNHRIIAGLGTRNHGKLRDYLVATRSAAVWLGPGKKEEEELLSMFLKDMKPAAGVYMGWWPSEGDGLEWIAQYGIQVLASDFFSNGSIYGGVRRQINVPPMPKPPPLENKVYVALIVSDGDNVQYMQHALMKFWAAAPRGTMPMGWTVSPLAVDLDPAMLNYYWSTATTADCLVSGPSGAGYAHINRWSDANIDKFAKVSGPYLQRAGLRVITVWDRVNSTVADAFARRCPNLLGLADEGGEYSAVNKGLRTIKLTPAYVSSVKEMVSGITNAASDWNGSAPVFVAAQADVWKLNPTDFPKIAAALDPSKYQFIRPDQLFILANEKKP